MGSILGGGLWPLSEGVVIEGAVQIPGHLGGGTQSGAPG